MRRLIPANTGVWLQRRWQSTPRRARQQQPTAVTALAENAVSDISAKWQKLAATPFLNEATEPLDVSRIPKLAHGLDKVLFRPGPHFMVDPLTGRSQFNKWIKDICQPEEFNYDAQPEYKIASDDVVSQQLALQHGLKYTSSTSSITAALAKTYLLVAQGKQVNRRHFSPALVTQPTRFTNGTRQPVSVILRYRNGVYAVDSDKDPDEKWNILQILGKSMEKALTATPEEFDMYRKGNEHQLTPENMDKDYHRYAKIENFLLRAQIDCYHPKLPNKTFDLKTRGTLPIRMAPDEYLDNVDYKITGKDGVLQSFEREDYDMLRSAMLKYSFQVRIGGMDGVFVAYHSTAEIFGFQYLPLKTMDRWLFKNSVTGDQAFAVSVKLLQAAFDAVTKEFPEQDVRVTLAQEDGLEHRQPLTVWAEPIPESPVDAQPAAATPLTLHTIHTASIHNGRLVTGALHLLADGTDDWAVEYRVSKSGKSPTELRDAYLSVRDQMENNGPAAGQHLRFLDEIRQACGLREHKKAVMASL
ncbi:hypothetical protein HDU87_007380 [Geranomyces variabilis]|uniref:Pet127-domain-containing protein n=1 Tax=Geranomyces variabilis TaxID=109894 RepID=A0AAD5XPS1_9FUNG|nr:hypothetical protein HDU87_007380 [Geranomyces variabilis]